MRTNPRYDELTPSCVRITSNSADFYLSVGVKISRSKLKKLIPSLAGINSEEALKIAKCEPLSIKGIEFSGYSTHKKQFNTVTLPKIEDVYNNKFLASSKPLTEKLQKKRRSPSKKSLVIKKESVILVEKPMPRQISPTKNKVITKISYKEASRFPEWAMIAKPELEKIWRSIITVSNGLRILPQAIQYRYFIGKGNNSALVRRLMVARSWWGPTETIEEAHFVWTQWKDKNYIQTLPDAKSKEHVGNLENMPSTAYHVPVKMNNVYRQVDLNDLGYFKIKNSLSYTPLETSDIAPGNFKIYNKLEFNQHLANKKGLFRCLKNYYEAIGKNVFDCHPTTFHIVNGEEDCEFARFLEAFNKIEKAKKKKKSKNLWIIKPGENSNRGNGIQVCKTLAEIKQILKDPIDPRTNQPRTYIVQKYIEKPFLVQNRKFDIRCYALITCINGIMQGYFYTDGYIRTSCAEYNLKDTTNNLIHLTNDAVQKHSEDYGKYEDNNKMSYKDLQRYFDFHVSDKNINFFSSILPKIKSIVKDTIHATFLKLDTNKRVNCMEIFGYDFMLDSKLKPWIIEVNTNPCLELASSYLSYLIPTMLDNAFRITLDTLYPSSAFSRNHDPIPENRFDLIFHQMVDGVKLLETLKIENSGDIEISDTEEMFSDHENNGDEALI